MKSLPVSISLNGQNWSLYGAKRGTPLSALSNENGQWIPACVPGNVQADVERAKLIKPIWFGPLDDDLTNLALKDWWYYKEIEITESLADKRAVLTFCGVDYSCDVYINGTHAGRNEGAFKRFSIDATKYLQQGTNVLHVKVDAMPEELLEWITASDGKMSGEGTDHFFVQANNKIRQTLKGLKCPGNCSYDWGTNIYTLGIWKDVELRITQAVQIDYIQVKALLNEDYSQGTAQVNLELNSTVDGKIRVVSQIAGNGVEKVQSAEFSIPAGNSKVQMEITIPNPALWWPNGYGEHPLYRVTSTVEIAGGPSDMATTRIGFRKIRWVYTKDAPSEMKNKFGLELNGKRIRTMGSCLVVPDLLHGRVGERGRFFIEMAAECNMTALRQHGGQVIFCEDMYDACDELGIMLLVDMPVGNCVLETDDQFLENLEDTIRNIIKQLRNHPSIMEWSGGNELDYYFVVPDDYSGLETERKAAEAEDDTRIFRDTCPIEGSRHAPWDYNPDLHYHYYNSNLTDNKGILPLIRYGEFGCQTPSNLEVWYRDFPVASQWPLNEDDPTQWRKNALNAVFDSDYWLRPSLIERFFGSLDDLEMTIKAGQYLGAEGMRYAVDALRARGERLGGFSSWDYNEPWPNGAGSFVIDYDGRPVMMYRFMQEGLEPIALQLKYDRIFYSAFQEDHATLRMVSDIPERAEGVRWTCTQRDRRGDVYAEISGTADIDNQQVLELATIKINPPLEMSNGPVFIELMLQDKDGKLLTRREYVFCPEGVKAPLRGLIKPEETPDWSFGIPYVTTGLRGAKVHPAQLKITGTEAWEDDAYEYLSITLQNTGAMTALFVEVHPLLNYRTDLIVRDNFISIPPQQTHTLLIKAHRGGNSTLTQTGFYITCFNAETVTVQPSNDVILYMGRKDSISREFRGYFDKKLPRSVVEADGRQIPADQVDYLLEDKAVFCFDTEQLADATLWVHVSDSSKQPCQVTVTLNGQEAGTITMESGYGYQKEQPDHLACPKSYRVDLPGSLFARKNKLELQITEGWFSWDAMEVKK